MELNEFKEKFNSISLTDENSTTTYTKINYSHK